MQIVERLIDIHRSSVMNEIYLTGEEVQTMFYISKRTLQILQNAVEGSDYKHFATYLSVALSCVKHSYFIGSKINTAYPSQRSDLSVLAKLIV